MSGRALNLKLLRKPSVPPPAFNFAVANCDDDDYYDVGIATTSVNQVDVEGFTKVKTMTECVNSVCLS